MMRRLLGFFLLFVATGASAESVIATRTIRANDILGPEDVTLSRSVVPGALQATKDAVGKEARVVLYAGRPIHPKDLGAPTLIGRNETVVLIYRTNSLSIATEGRALGRAGVGDRLRVMNIASRSTVDGVVDGQGRVIVSSRSGTLDSAEDQ